MKLALGTVQFGLPYGVANQKGQVNRDEVKVILDLARVGGIDTLDTAIAYGDSEACLGEANVENFKLVTKLPVMPESVINVDNWVYDNVRGSLRRLGTGKIYGLLLHRSQQLVGFEGRALAQALKKLKTDGLVEKIGVSIYSPSELDTVIRSCPIDLVQAPFNLVDRRLYVSGWLQRLNDLGIEVHSRSVFLQGLLLMSRAAVPLKFQPWSFLWDRWHYWLAEHSFSAPQACIGFVQAYSQISRIVVGVDSSEQLQELIIAANTKGEIDWPDIVSDDENLVNPSYWSKL